MRYASLFTLALIAAPPAPAPAQQAPDRFQRALEEVGNGELENAVRILETIPHPEPLQVALLGGLYLEIGRAAEALVALQPLADQEGADPAVLYNAGRAAMATGQSQRAQSYLERSVIIQRNSPAARELGLLYGAQQRFEDAYLLLAPWAKTNPDDLEARMAAALCAVRLERVPEAEEQLSDLPQEHPRVRLLWGQLLLQKGDPWGALATLKPALEDPPLELELDLRRTAAQGHLAVGQAAEAVDLLDGHVRGDPSLALQLGRAHFQNGEVDKALLTVQPFAEALVNAGAPPAGVASELPADISREYGRFLVSARRFQEAVPYLELSTALAPADKRGWQSLGQALAGAGRREEAREVLARFEQLTSSEPSASDRERLRRAELEDPTGRELHRGLALLAAGRAEEALVVAQREARLAVNDPRPLLLQGRALLVLKRLDEAQQTAEALVGALPENADVYYLRGAVRMSRREPVEAESDFRRALSLEPDHTASMNDLAVLLMNSDRSAEAQVLLERVLTLSPGDPVARENLDKLR